MYYQESIINAMTEQEWHDLNQECVAGVERLTDQGNYVTGQPLQPVETATVPTANKAQYIKHASDAAVVFSWLVWPSHEVRDQAMQKVMEDPRLHPDVNPMPFDGKRLIYGGFEVVVEE